MAHTYTQIQIHIIFTVNGIDNLIPKKNKDELEKYITGIVQERTHKLLAISCMPDHTHVFIGMRPEQSMASLIQEIKTTATKFIKRKGWRKNFSWQRGYGAFTYSEDTIPKIATDLENQEEYHKMHTFKDEFYNLLKVEKIDFDEKYMFEFYDVIDFNE